MTKKLEGRVALVTGAARGQGRSHALALAAEGAAIIGLDIADQIGSVPYPMATEADLHETKRLIEEAGGTVITRISDVRDPDAMRDAVERGLHVFSHIDIVVANAGIVSLNQSPDLTVDQWRDMIDVNLNGVWYTVQPVLRPMIKQGAGSIILISSVWGLKAPRASLVHYTAAKHGVVGIMRQLANEMAEFGVRVNSIHPTQVATQMVDNEATRQFFLPTNEDRSDSVFLPALAEVNNLNVPWIQAEDVSKAVVYLASDDARYVTGTTMTVDAGVLVK